MSSVVTNELFNQKQLHVRPTQLTLIEDDFLQTLADQGHFKVPTVKLDETLTQPDLAEKRKLVVSITWDTSADGNTILWNRPLTFAHLVDYIPTANLAMYHSFRLQVDFQPSTNFLWQGKAIVVFDPSIANWYASHLREPTITDYFQMNHVLLEAGKRSTIVLDVPLIWVWNFFFKTRGTGGLANKNFTYFSEYVMGSIKLVSLTKLQTQSGQTSLNINVNYSLLGYTNGANLANYASVVVN